MKQLQELSCFECKSKTSFELPGSKNEKLDLNLKVWTHRFVSTFQQKPEAKQIQENSVVNNVA